MFFQADLVLSVRELVEVVSSKPAVPMDRTAKSLRRSKLLRPALTVVAG
jgi:hypothetical protein